MLSGLSDWVVDVIDRLGYVGVALLVALENLFPPIPSEIVLPFAGFVARDGGATLPGMIIAATIGSLVGRLGAVRDRRRGSARCGSSRSSSATASGSGSRRPTSPRPSAGSTVGPSSAVLVGRCVPLIRSLVSIPAGFRRMPLRHVHAVHGDRRR